MIKGEFWLTPDGLEQCDDTTEYNHEGYVVSCIISIIADYLGVEWDGGPDWIAFKSILLDEVFPSKYPNLDSDLDEYDLLAKELEGNGFKSAKMAAAAIRACNPNDDARFFAINYWKWIRIAGSAIEVPDFDQKTLSRAGDGLWDICEMESDYSDDVIRNTMIRVSTYNSNPKRYDISIGELIDGEKGASRTDLEDIAKSGGDAVRKMNQDAMHPHYKGKLGDSLITLRSVLAEVKSLGR